MLTLPILHQAFSSASATILAPLNAAMAKHDLISVDRTAAFVAQCGIESAGFTRFVEDMNYSAAGLIRTFPHAFPTLAIAASYEHQPLRIASRAYADRLGNGDEDTGDGARFLGRGLIMITGRDNYSAFGAMVARSAEQAATYITTLQGACESATWFWHRAGCNSFADNGDMHGLTRAINGPALLQLAERTHAFETLRAALMTSS